MAGQACFVVLLSQRVCYPFFNETDERIRTGRDNSNSSGGGRMHFDLLID